MPHGSPITITRKPQKFSSDDKRVIARYFQVGGEHRAKNVLNRVAELTDAQVTELLAQVIDDFGHRHRTVEATFDRHFGNVRHYLDDPDALSLERKLLIGSYFTMEYAIESAAALLVSGTGTMIVSSGSRSTTPKSRSAIASSSPRWVRLR